ncbi:unnamed protein product [Didymodactylos carnosus]|uniref:SGNH domain-containing protein n=1 Tax=Didymodactylos carnosus TaxID=1234261 RepID=A0A815IF97_9BILA|nr:unnamed protein product [Didymodactylos carnosus]CAF1364225.1 unnamed protein product [Didymodactylos carnosus]CAF3692393.1 unnamed protein product [Didymodactylos carnosus]CAF4245028.1 unnamed protein product [Didymodactylos carnosus]
MKNTTTFDQTSHNKTRIALIGDSYAKDLFNAIIESKQLLNYQIRVHFIQQRCQIYLGPEDLQKWIPAKAIQFCKANKEYHIKYALPLIRQANIIFLAGRWRQWSALRLSSTIKALNLTRDQQVFVIGAKHFGKVNPRLYVDKTNEYRIKQRQFPPTDELIINEILEKTIDKSMFVNVQKMLCTGPNNTCPLFTPEGKLITYDGYHLTKYGAGYLGKILFSNSPLNRLL